MNTTDPAITVSGVSIALPREHYLTKQTILEGVDFVVHRGEFFLILGPSGSGKSTLLRIMSGLEHRNRGSVTFGEGMGAGDISFVFQQFAVLPWLTVAENAAMGLTGRGVSATEIHSRVTAELRTLGLERVAHERPRSLSGGMRQRVGLARALVTNPKVIFMDEPFSELDSFTAAELRQDLLSIWEQRRPTIVMVSHLVSEAVQLADRIAVMADRPGRIEQTIVNHLPRPRKERSAEFYELEDRLAALVEKGRS